jgi:putative ABC transport system permease protein
MTLTGLAFAYARRRPLATLLVVVLAALGVAIAVLTLILSNELESRMRRDAEGVDLVVGAKGSPLQLVLAGVYHADVAPGNIPYAALERLRANRSVGEAIPLALGDSVAGFRIVGTEAALAGHYGARLAAGAMFEQPMQAVLGSDVAKAAGLAVGSTFAGTHGLAVGGAAHDDDRYTVVGILAPTGRVVDRLVLTPVESVWDVHASHQGTVAHADRELTMVLVRFATPLAAATLAREINAQSALVAASPALETARMFTVFGVGLDVVRAFAGVLVGASMLLLFVALAQALEERRYDLAILRALGARRTDLVFVLMAESVALALAGALLGVAIAHVAAASIGAWLPAAAPLASAAWRFSGNEGLVVALAVGGGILAACWPAWRASRLDVAATLSDS